MADKSPNAPRGFVVGQGWPAWFYGPDGATKLCVSEADVPDGWMDGPHKKPAAPAPQAAEAPTTAAPLTLKPKTIGRAKPAAELPTDPWTPPKAS